MEFTPGINIIVGKNNAGKTSLLEVLTLDFENQPHRILDFEKYPDRSLRTLQKKGVTLKKESKIEITLHIEKEELRSFMKQMSSSIFIPQIFYNDDDHVYRSQLEDVQHKNSLTKEAFNIFQSFLENPDCIELHLSLNAHINLLQENLIKLLNFGCYETTSYQEFYKLKYDNGELNLEVNEYNDSSDVIEVSEEYYCELGGEFPNYAGKIDESIGKKLFDIFVSRIYRFKAERLNIGSCKYENNEQMKSDASNLAEVLFILQGKKPGTFSEFNKKVSRILEEIKYISVVMGDNSDLEIKVWITEELNRDDLSLPLSSCGSGVGQVLAIVYILVSSEEPRTLIIDEPQSFLHPGAAKKLIETIKQFPQHQYFISTHSPDIITTADPSNIIKLQYKDCETTASVINAKDIELQRGILDELGVRLSDVFGADSVLWVEGPTEEKSFPLIIEKFLAEIPLKGMKILSVKSTDALLDGKHSSLVANIYEKLKSGISLIPEKSIFIFDREGKKPENIKDLERIGFNFLKRPMYENYILHSEAIAAIINEEAQAILEKIGFDHADSQWLKSPITSNQVQQCLDKIKQDKQFLFPDVNNDDWFSKVHGADVIHNVFQELCENQLHFNGNKPKYCRKITEWLIKNQPEFLSEIAKELKECLNKDK
jgi:AAA15 family ATPase/GTPase